MQQIDFGALLHAIPDAVLIADRQGRIVYANPSVERVLERAAGELIGESLHVIQPPRMWPAHDTGFGRWSQTGVGRLFGAPIRVPALLPDGSERDVELNLAQISGPAGERLVVAVLRDLRERVELERQLSVLRYLRATTAAAARLWTRLDPALVLSTLTDVLVADFDSVFARAWIHEPETNSLRLMASSGLSTNVEQSSRARIDLATYPYKVGVVARTRRPIILNQIAGDDQFEEEWLRREGLRSVVCMPLLAGDALLGVMVSFSRQPIFDEGAETIANLAALASAALNDARLVAQERAARDRADRARLHFELLAEVSEKLAASLEVEATVQSVADALVPSVADWCVVDLVNEDRTLQTVASAHCDPGLNPLIRELRAGYPPRDGGEHPHAIHRAIKGRRTVAEPVSDAQLVERAVDERHLRLLRTLGIGSQVVATLESRGRVLGAISLVRRPDREAFDADDVATTEDIARRAALATDNATLYRSAQQAVELRDRFMAVASHELRTPLAVVYGHWELLGRWLRGGTAVERNVERIDGSMRRLGQGIEQLRRLVEELLDVSQLTRGPMELRLARVDLADLVRQSVEDLRGQTGTGRVRLDLPDGPITGIWDAARLRQVIANLLLNAVKYSPHQGAVEVALEPGDGKVRLRVTDEGIGVPAQELEAIFEPFSRAKNASAQHYPGLGVGLAVSREIVTRLGGRMWAESAGEGRGSTFFVELDTEAGGGPDEMQGVEAGAQP